MVDKLQPAHPAAPLSSPQLGTQRPLGPGGGGGGGGGDLVPGITILSVSADLLATTEITCMH